MKPNSKKKIFILLMCATMFLSTMSIWAGYDSATLGDIPREQSLC